MPEELRERVLRDVSTVEWPEGRTLRKRAGRRRARRVVAGCAAVVAALAVVWTVVPLPGLDGSNRPADVPERAAGMLKGTDVGPGWRVDAWGHYDGGTDEQMAEWPATWLTGCPAYAAGPPVGFRNHVGGSMIRADPPSGTVSAPVQEFVMRFADEATAGAVLDEARHISTVCASYDVAGRQRYTATVVAEDFAGDDAVRLDLTGVRVESTTGGQVGIPGIEVFVMTRVGRVVIMLTAAGRIDAAWLQDLAPDAVSRLCAETDDC